EYGCGRRVPSLAACYSLGPGWPSAGRERVDAEAPERHRGGYRHGIYRLYFRRADPPPTQIVRHSGQETPAKAGVLMIQPQAVLRSLLKITPDLKLPSGAEFWLVVV